MKNSSFYMLLLKLLPVLTNIKYFFHKDFIKENYYKHFLYTILLLLPMYFLLFGKIAKLQETHYLFIIFIGYGMGYALNFVREWYMAIKYKAPFSFVDIIFGAYGGTLGILTYYHLFVK